jgi:hypothetical protein
MNPTQSNAAHCARVLCIVFMSYVHLHFFKLPGADFPLTQIIIVDTFGRSSVPLLSVLSGYFMVGFFAKRSYTTAALSRGRSLIAPMLIWNLIACLLLGFTGPIWDALFAVTDNSKLIYLTFLRDLFIMSLLTPALVVCAKKAPAVFIAAIVVYYVLGWSNIVILRPQIAFFFSLGIFFAIYPQPMPKWSGVIAIVGILAAIAFQIVRPNHLAGFYYFDNLYLRPMTAFSFWVVSLWIAQTWPRFGRFDKTAFAFFVMHGIAFYIVGSVYSKITSMHIVPLYYTVWLLTPLVVYAGVYAIWPLTGKTGRVITA